MARMIRAFTVGHTHLDDDMMCLSPSQHAEKLKNKWDKHIWNGMVTKFPPLNGNEKRRRTERSMENFNGNC